MKAIILAGGEGIRLRPISMGMPKAMVPLLGRPVLEHLLRLLSRHGITEVCVAMNGRQKGIQEHFENGDAFGVSIRYCMEEVPLGTAGAVKNCAEFIGGDQVLVMGGDSVCDLDLTRAVEFHREKQALATIVITSHPRPLEYGMVLTDEQGRVEQFLEKPAWEQVVTNMVNTGIYILSPALLERIPKGEERDFGKDVFPALMESGEQIYACALEGYWRDMGDCEGYLACVADVLSAKVKLEHGLEQRAPGVWSADPVPEGVTVVPPCWIGPEVRVGSGSLIGPHVVLEAGSRIGKRSLVQRSVLMGAQIGDRATAYGAILCPGSRAGDETVLNEGVVLGGNALAADRAVLMERVRLWPGRTTGEGVRLNHSVTGSGQLGPMRFGDGGVIRGTLGEDLDPERMVTLGRVLGAEGKVALGCFGGPGAQMLARAAASGIAAAGGTALYHDMECAAQAAWLGESYQLPVSLFIEQQADRIYLHFFDSWSLPLGRGRERKLEHALLQGGGGRAEEMKIGRCERLPTSVGDYARDAVRRASLRRGTVRSLRVAVTGEGAENRAVRIALEALGCQVSDQWRRGIPAFTAGHGGLRLTARDESGALISSQQLLAAVALVELENGGGRLAVPDEAGAAVELIAAGFDKKVQRLGQDGEEARKIYRSLPWLRDAVFAAVRLCARMAMTGERLEQLVAKTPRLVSWQREVPLCRDRGEVMRELSVRVGREAVSGAGLRLRSRGGWVYLVPLARRSAVKIVAEGPDLELAAELCDFYAGQVAELDRTNRSRTK
ncbi:MAG: hypothetical protein E7440_02330 [Ruminococcaceae bacterium]|nr:hypothetical protein [Oscillospiraceae bacterium]